jgi:hypothetical protein
MDIFNSFCLHEYFPERHLYKKPPSGLSSLLWESLRMVQLLRFLLRVAMMVDTKDSNGKTDAGELEQHQRMLYSMSPNRHVTNRALEKDFIIEKRLLLEESRSVSNPIQLLFTLRQICQSLMPPASPTPAGLKLRSRDMHFDLDIVQEYIPAVVEDLSRLNLGYLSPDASTDVLGVDQKSTNAKLPLAKLVSKSHLSVTLEH